MPPSAPAAPEAVLVCGLGSIGMECLASLRSYAVPVRALDIRAVAELDASTPFTSGDCRDADALAQAGVGACRAIVLACGDAHANVEGALVARKLNARVRIVMRTDGEALSTMLSSALGNFVAFEPNRLAAGALALAALATEMLGHFRVEGSLERVVRHRVARGDAWDGLTIDEVQERGFVALDATHGEPRDEPAGDLFHRFDPAHKLAPGDVLTVLARGPAEKARAPRKAATSWLPAGPLSRSTLVVLVASGVIVLAIGLALVLFPSADPTLSPTDAFYSALVMMTGGTYADLFPAFHFLSGAMRFFSVLLSVIGTVGAGLLYAWLTEQLLQSRFRIAKRRPPVPSGGHVVVVGLGRVGRHAIDHLAELGYDAVAIETGDVEDHVQPRIAVVRGSGTDREALRAARVETARGVLAATASDWLNFEVALRAREVSPDAAVVVRARDPRFTGNVRDALPGLRALCVPVLAAKAFAAAALGENVLDVFQLGPRTVFVIEYEVASDDTLHGELVSSIAEGYSVVPVAHARSGEPLRPCSPQDHARRLRAGDRLVVLGPTRSLQAIERGDAKPRAARVAIQRLSPIADALAVARVLAQQLDYSLEEGKRAAARERELEPLYPHQAHRLVRELERLGAAVTVE